ncbi:complement factor H-like [Apostichopus japonicus]|uniref:complement factor H-like n=1 Tax=Stichopus japonicus TaxID=307972 RepID=UPI003AB706D2
MANIPVVRMILVLANGELNITESQWSEEPDHTVPLLPLVTPSSFGEWQGFELLCERVSCSREEFSNGQFVYYGHNNQRTTNPHHGGRLQAVCEPGTHFIDGVVLHTSRCWNGQWEQEVPSCVGDPCPPLVNHPDNLAITYSVGVDGSHYPHSTLATFHRVEEGFVLENVNEEQRTCRRGEWRGPNTYPRCTIAICEVRLVDTGYLHYMNDTVITRPPRHGDRVTVTCNDGFNISDVIENVTCVNGVWNHVLPTCVEAKCLAVSSVDYLTIFYDGASSSENEFDPGTELEVTCRDELIPDRTESSFCRNGQWSPSIPRC